MPDTETTRSRPGPGDASFRLTVLGTTDTHGNILNWDYFSDTEFDDARHNDVGLAKISTLIKAVREDRGHCATVTLDAGDTIQGTQLCYYYARIDPITGASAPIHPVAAAMNAIGYDAAALGNHEFNYGLETLRTFQSQLRHPLLGANALHWQTTQAAFEEFIIKPVPVGDHDAHRGHGPNHQHGPGDVVKVGIVGLVTPGCAVWDKANLDGRISFNGIVEQARIVIPRVKEAGADVVIVCCHSGADTSSSYGDALPWPENAATVLAEQVPGIDAILVGHAHVEIPQRFVTGPDGRPVLLSEPLKWGERLTVMDLDLVQDRHGWRVWAASSTVLNANTVPEDPEIVQQVARAHQAVRGYVNGVIGTSSAPMSAAASRYQDTAAIGFINHVQADALTAALAGSSWAALPVLSIAAPVNPDASIPAGPVTVRDLAGLYPYDNTLLGIILTGEQLRAYLEFSAAYFRQVSGSGPFLPDQLTNAVTPTAPTGRPDYNYDIVSGFGASLSYRIDVAEPVGARILNLSYQGVPVAPDQRFVVAINNYRQSGGGGFPGVTTAPVVYDAQVEIRQLIMDWVRAQQRIDPSVFSQQGWKLVAGGEPIVISTS